MGVLLSKKDESTLKRELYKLRRQFTTLTRRLANVNPTPVGGFLPPARIRFLNASSETVPARGVMRITGGSTDQRGYLTCDKPSSIFQSILLVNGAREIRTNRFGFGRFLTAESFRGAENLVLCDGTPATGESWGAANGSWALSQHRPGFLIATPGSAGYGVAIQAIVASVFGKPASAIAAGATTGTVNVWDGHFTGSLSLQVANCHNPSDTALATTDKVFVSLCGTKNTVGKIC